MRRALLATALLSVVSITVAAEPPVYQTSPYSGSAYASVSSGGNGQVWDETSSQYGAPSEPSSAVESPLPSTRPSTPQFLNVPQNVSQDTPQNVQRVEDPNLYETNPPPEAGASSPIRVGTRSPWTASNGFWGDEALQQARGLGPWAENTVLTTSGELNAKLSQAAAEGKPYLIWVNVPSYTLRVYDTSTQALLLTSRVIVGATGSQTPIFETNVVNLKYNPDWSPPASLQRKGKRYVPPGPNNPLGQVRFSTDNNKSIYLHDTNHHELFDRNMRALSAGCVRVSRWNELAQILSGEGAEAVAGHTAGNSIKYVKIPTSLVWISYQRVDLDDTGTLTVFPDVYRRQPLPNN